MQIYNILINNCALVLYAIKIMSFVYIVYWTIINALKMFSQGPGVRKPFGYRVVHHMLLKI